MSLCYSTDIVIVGGGIAGLWLLKRLRLEGYQAILLESSHLGGGQTLASQGIIHGGLKYALHGKLSTASNALARMPARWRRCLAGKDAMDLRSVRRLSECYYLWSSAGFRARLKTFLGGKSLRGRVQTVGKQDLPAFFRQAGATGSLYRLPDFVIDPGSLIAELSKGQQDHLFLIPPDALGFRYDAAQRINGISIDCSGHTLLIDCQKCIFSAGEGNARLLARSGIHQLAMQRRPLHMVYLIQQTLPTVYAHCIGDDFSLTPALTVTSHRDAGGRRVWYLGGELAESGVTRTASEQIAAARQQLQQRFPRIDFTAAEWYSLLIDRAEARMADQQRPDDAVCSEHDNAIVVFPTKFTLAPALADNIVNQLQAAGVTKGAEQHNAAPGMRSTRHLRARLPPPPLGCAPWENHASRR